MMTTTSLIFPQKYWLKTTPTGNSKGKKKTHRLLIHIAMSCNDRTAHGGIGHKTLLKTDALDQIPPPPNQFLKTNYIKPVAYPHKHFLLHLCLKYILETNVYPREHPAMKELRDVTEKHPWALMSTAVDEAQFLSMLMKLINAKNTMEIGVFTGYSLLATALALPHDAKILAIDPDRESYEMGLPILKKAGVEHKIDFKESEALPILDDLIKDVKNHGTFDFVFVDADKENYKNYHTRVLELVKVGGVIGYDNTLWNGSIVAPPDEPLADYIVESRPYLLEFNKILASDSRVEICQLSIGDGITLCRRLT